MVSKLDAKKVQLGKLDAQVKVILKCVTLLAIKGAGKGPGIRGGGAEDRNIPKDPQVPFLSKQSH